MTAPCDPCPYQGGPSESGTRHVSAGETACGGNDNTGIHKTEGGKMSTSATAAQDVQTPASCANRTGGVADWIGVDSMSVPNPGRAGKPRPPAKPIPADLAQKLYERLMKRVELDPATGCLIRTVAINPQTGYSSISVRVDGKASYYYTHRAAWTHLRGPIPDQMTIDHLCKRRACVNVDHMEVVTAQVNILRSDNPMARFARRTHCKRGHELPPRRDGVARRCSECHRIRRAARLAAKEAADG